MNIQGKNITEVFRDEMHEQCDHCQSIFSPAAYLVKLLETIDKYIKPKDALRKRRPDLYELKLDCDHTLKEKPYLEIVCEILEKRLDADNDEDKKLGPWLKSFAISDGLPFFLRGCFPLVAIRTYLKENKTSLEQIYRLCFPEVDLTAESLGLSKEQYALMIDPNQELSNLKKFYGLTSSLSNLNSRKCFLQHTGIKAEELTEFLKAYNTIKKPSKVLFISQSDVIENLDTSALVFLHGFVSLSRALDWSFEALSYIFLALGADKVDAETVKKIANIHWFEKRLQKDLKAAYKTFVVEESLDPSTSLLYLSGTLFEEKVRKLLKGKKNYDEFAGVYIHDIESSDQVGVLQGILYAQSTLARWMGIPIKELIDMMRLLGTENMMNLSKADDVNKLIALHDTLDQYGVNATILSQSMKADDKAIKERYGTQLEELIKAIKNITPWDDLEFSHVLGRYFTLPQDVLVSIVHFSEERVSRYFKKNGDKYKYRNKDMDGLNELLMELIHDIQMLSLLGLRAEDIDHISIYFEKTYDALNGIRSISSIEKILEYKKLKAIFAGHPLSLPRYIDWFYSKEYDQKALIEKISTLSGWDKEVLDLLQADTSFKDCFSEAKDPVKALNKIYSFMDLVSTSGLSAKTLLDLNKLRELPCNTKEAWRMYTKAVSDLELLGVGSDERKENQKKLLERKRDWLCQYMFYKNGTFENMRDLYSELLIDVEMGGCSKISSLKAALNSAQLYLHRCSMRLEEGVRIDPGLSNQTLELLTHYRRWEANQKIQTYPENYLDPTLRKIASPQYKELQNTLMQGHITDESVSEAYLKYFEDFDRLASLEIIDSYFEVVEDPISGGQKDTMFLLGRSITHPYTYHYCTAIFSSKNQKISYWTPWQKIEASIPVDTVTAAYAFGRFFIFWIQKVEKRKARAEKKSDNTAYEDLTTCSIHYVFQRVRNGWSTTQTLADDLEIPHAKKDALCWKKVAIMLFKDKQQEGARHMLVSIGDIGDKENQVQWFLIDEDLVAKKQSHKLSLDRFVGSYRAHPQNLGKIIDDVFLIKNIDFQTFFLKKNRGIAIYDHDQELWEEPLYQTEGSSDVAVAVIKLNENKKAIFFGGKTKINTYSSTIDIYDVSARQWITAVPPNSSLYQASEARSGATVAVVQSKAIFFGGETGANTYSAAIDIYDADRMQWTKAVQPDSSFYQASEARFGAVAAVVQSKAIFFGGKTGANTYSTAIDVYDAEKMQWTKAVQPDNSSYQASEARFGVAAAVVQSKAIFFGGETGANAYSAAIDIYDAEKMQWTKAVQPNSSFYQASEARSDAAVAIVMNAKAIFFGGKTGAGTYSKAIDICDCAEGRWESFQAHEGRFDTAVAILTLQGGLKGKAIFFGGKTGADTYSKAIDIYDCGEGTNNGWTNFQASEARSGAAVAVVGSKAIFFGGKTGANAYSSAVDIYDAEQDKWINFKVVYPLKDPTVIIRSSKVIFIGLGKDKNTYAYDMSKDFSDYKPHLIHYFQEDKKLRAGNLYSNLLYANLFPNATVSTPLNDSIDLLENYTEEASGIYPVRNLMDSYMVKKGLEVFLVLPECYTQYRSIGAYLFYTLEAGNSFCLEYSPPAKAEPSLQQIKFSFLRLNMPKAVSALRQKAYAGGVKRLLTLEAQKFDFPGFENFSPTVKVLSPDGISAFSGPYGLYLWEIFFHIPTLIAHQLRDNQDFPTAKKWYQYIMDPIREHHDIWRFLPFRSEYNHQKIIASLDNGQIHRDLQADPFDAYSLAAQKITSFEKYMVISYIENLLSWADMVFEQGSWECLNEATMLYIRAWDLLGKKPMKKERAHVESKSYDELKNAYRTNSNLLELEKELDLPHTIEVSSVPSCNEAMSMTVYSDYFCTPENEDFVGLWDKLQERLYKIRHCLDIKGKPYMPALFEPALDPKALMLTSVAESSDIMVPGVTRVPFYRFLYMIGYAKSTVDAVIDLGAKLLSVMEKKDAEALSALYNKQETILAVLITPIKEKAIEALKEEGKALNEGLNNAQKRKGYYDDLIKKSLSGKEKTAASSSSEAIDLRDISNDIRGGVAAAHLIPTVYGFSVGDFHPGFSVDALAVIFDSKATIADESAQMKAISASYERRSKDWTLQKDMADYDIKQIQAHIEANSIRQAIAEKDLQTHQKSIEQMREKKDFFEKKFTREEIYTWMKGQIASIYFQAYKLAVNVAKQTEKTYQYELNSDEVFIKSSGWNSLREGLLVGHHLKFALEQMHMAYHDKNERPLEISKSISLKQIDPHALYELKAKGDCIFSLSEKLFDRDFPGHYKRKIKALRMTVPAIVGPYENVHASLQQTSHKTVLKAEGNAIEAVKFLLGGKGSQEFNDPSVLRGSMDSNEQIVLSKGYGDSGMFELNFNDERYLPFEGTGVVSDWKLILRRKNNRFDPQSISDVIIHLDYTAFDGGENFRTQVEGLEILKSHQGILAVDLIAVFPDEWEQFKQAKGKAGHLFTFRPSSKLFPTYLTKIEVDPSEKLYVIPILSESESHVKIEQLNKQGIGNDHSLEIKSSKDFVIEQEWGMQISGDAQQFKEILLLLPYKGQRL